MLSEIEVLEVACQVWADFLGRVALPVKDAVMPRRGLVTGLVHYVGVPSSGMALTMQTAHARELAASVFILDDADLVDDDIDDLMIELATIFARFATERAKGGRREMRADIKRSGMLDGELVEGGEPLVSTVVQSESSLVLVRLF